MRVRDERELLKPIQSIRNDDVVVAQPKQFRGQVQRAVSAAEPHHGTARISIGVAILLVFQTR
jgi:hypothetical protein